MVWPHAASSHAARPTGGPWADALDERLAEAIRRLVLAGTDVPAGDRTMVRIRPILGILLARGVGSVMEGS